MLLLLAVCVDESERDAVLVKKRDATVLSETFVNRSMSSQIAAGRCAGRREHYVMMEDNELCIDYKKRGGAE